MSHRIGWMNLRIWWSPLSLQSDSDGCKIAVRSPRVGLPSSSPPKASLRLLLAPANITTLAPSVLSIYLSICSSQPRNLHRSLPPPPRKVRANSKQSFKSVKALPHSLWKCYLSFGGFCGLLTSYRVSLSHVFRVSQSLSTLLPLQKLFPSPTKIFLLKLLRPLDFGCNLRATCFLSLSIWKERVWWELPFKFCFKKSS